MSLTRELVNGEQVNINPQLASRGVNIRSSHQVVPAPPWDKVQFHRYDTEFMGDQVVTKQRVFSIGSRRFFDVVHTYTEGSGTVEFTDYPFQTAALRYIGDGFAPWTLVDRGILSMHAASVLVDQALLVFLGYHNAGKSTLATRVANTFQGLRVSDDALDLVKCGAGWAARASIWEEACQPTTVTPKRIIIFWLDNDDQHYEDGTKRSFGPIMQLMQATLGAYCSDETFTAAERLGQQLVAASDLVVLPARPDPRQVLPYLARSLGN